MAWVGGPIREFVNPPICMLPEPFLVLSFKLLISYMLAHAWQLAALRLVNFRLLASLLT
jgi:hypothetical protein